MPSAESRTDVPGARPVSKVDGVNIYRLAGDDIPHSPFPIPHSHEPYTFRLGLFLMCVGVGALSCVGVYRALRYKKRAKR